MGFDAEKLRIDVDAAIDIFLEQQAILRKRYDEWLKNQVGTKAALEIIEAKLP